MLAIPISILALAAGVALLIKVKAEALGGIYRALSWLVVLLSLLFMICLVAMGIIHHRHAANMRNEREMRFREFNDMRMKHFQHLMGDSTMMKGDSTAMMDDTTMKGKGMWHHHGGGMRHHHRGEMGYHRGGGMHRDWMKHEGWKGNAYVPKDSIATANK